MIYRLFTVAAVVMSSSIAVAQNPIERIAPENTILIAGTKDFKGMSERFQNTPLWALWNSEQLQKMRADMMKEMGEGVDKMLEELGVEKDSLVAPRGPVGLALFTTRDPELDTPMVGFMMVADYGDAANAEKTDAIVQAALAKGEKEGQIEFDHKDIGGRTVYTIDLAKLESKAAANDEMGDIDMGGGLPIPMPSAKDMMKGVTKLHYVRDGNALLLSSDMDTLADAMDSPDAKKGQEKHATDRPEVKAILEKLGDSDVYAVLLTRDLMDLVAANDPMGIAPMVRSMARSAVGEVQGYGYSARFDGATAMMEQTITAYMPKGKQGLTTLMDVPAKQGALPPFVGADTISYSNVSFRFAGVMDALRKVVASNPMLQMQGAGEYLEQAAPMVSQITATMGTQVVWATSSAKPYTAGNRQSMFAIECTKPQEFENLISGLAAQGGMEARDFLGQRIYTMPEGMMDMLPVPGMDMGPMSLGIGGGYILLGATSSVEQGLRSTSQPGNAGLASNTDYQRAVAALSKEGVVAWGYTNTVDALESSLAVQRAAMEEDMKAMMEDMNAEGEDGGEDAKAFQAHMEEQMKQSTKMFDLMDFNLLRQHIGPAAWQVQSTEDGFVMRWYQLGAAGGKP